MDIMEMARELGQAIAESPQMTRVKETEAAQAADAEAQKLVGEYNDIRTQLSHKAQNEKLTGEALDAVRNELEAEFNKLLTNDKINAFVTAQQEFEAVMGQINNIISFYVNGQQQSGGCSADGCASCSGCH